MSKKDFSFEEAMVRLEEIVRILEGGNTSLNDSMKLYEEGVALVREAIELLSKAKQKLIVVNGEEAQ
jgi:exodeoxyribonuclease VII small subunit